MRIKHYFFLTLLFTFSLSGQLFGFSTGPDPGMNGIFGQTCLACHTGAPLNAAPGSVSISGLPATWTPGQTYALTVTITRTGQRRWGFQLSAVVDATNVQAGTLAGSGPVRVTCGGGTAATASIPTSCGAPGAIQYAEHSNAISSTTGSGTYSFSWTAPAVAVGPVRFNVAGNAANGDFTTSGDFIYTAAATVDAAAAPPPTGVSTKAFTIVNLGGTSSITDGSGGLSVGYARIQPNAGSTTPSGVAIFGASKGTTLFTEAGVPASPRLTSARIYAEVTGTVNTGVAIANPNDQPATINFHFTDSNGADFGASSFTIDPNKQFPAYLDQPPFNVLSGRSSFQGTFSFTSSVEVAVIGLRLFRNERMPPDELITTLPVTNLSAAAASGTVYLAYFADGDGWATQVVLVNPTDSTLTGTIQFFDRGSGSTPASPAAVKTTSGQVASSFNYSIPRRSSFKLVTDGSPPVTQTGSVRIVPSAGAAPSAVAVFSYKPGGFVTLSEAGVPGNQGSAFRMYAEETASSGPGAIATGLAITNLGSALTTVNLELSRLDGSSTGLVASNDVPGNGQVVGFLHDFFPSLTLPFQGILRISGGGAQGLSMVGLRTRYNDQNDFLITTTPPVNEGSPPTSAEFLFPHLINGGGYTTQFILFSGTAGQASSGNLKFFTLGGVPMNLTLK